jgi:hypothetical protein
MLDINVGGLRIRSASTSQARFAEFSAVAQLLYSASARLSMKQHQQLLLQPTISSEDAEALQQTAANCDFGLSALDSIDKLPAYQVDLWNAVSGIPAPTTCTLALASLTLSVLLQAIMHTLEKLGIPSTQIKCTESFVRRYAADERPNVAAHVDRSRITGKCSR